MAEKDEESFEQEFNNLAAEKDGTPKLDPVFTKDQDTNPDPDGGDNPDNDNNPATDEKKGDADPDENTPDNGKTAEDPYAGLDEATKERLIALEESNNALQHRVDSDNGRVGAFQRKVNDLTAQLEQIQANSDKPKASEEEIAKAMESDEGWESFKDEYTEQATAIENYMDRRIKEQEANVDARVNEVLAPVSEQIAEQNAVNAYEAVENEFPGWQDEVNSSTFNTWFESQNAAIQNLANSDDAKDASDLMGLYDTFRVSSSLEPLRKADHDQNIVVENVDEIAERRARQLEDGVAIPSRAAKIDPSADTGGEFDTAFAAFAKKKDTKRQA